MQEILAVSLLKYLKITASTQLWTVDNIAICQVHKSQATIRICEAYNVAICLAN